VIGCRPRHAFWPEDVKRAAVIDGLVPYEIFRGRILSTDELAALRREIESFDAIEVRISSSIVLIKSAEHVFGDLAATSEAQPLALQLNVIVAQFVTSLRAPLCDCIPERERDSRALDQYLRQDYAHEGLIPTIVGTGDVDLFSPNIG
jgi:hypothetical protein